MPHFNNYKGVPRPGMFLPRPGMFLPQAQETAQFILDSLSSPTTESCFAKELFEALVQELKDKNDIS